MILGAIIIIIWIIAVLFNSNDILNKSTPQVQFSIYPYNEFIGASTIEVETIIGRPDTTFIDYYTEKLTYVYGNKDDYTIFDPSDGLQSLGALRLSGICVKKVNFGIRYHDGSVRYKIYCCYSKSTIIVFDKAKCILIRYPDGTKIKN